MDDCKTLSLTRPDKSPGCFPEFPPFVHVVLARKYRLGANPDLSGKKRNDDDRILQRIVERGGGRGNPELDGFQARLLPQLPPRSLERGFPLLNTPGHQLPYPRIESLPLRATQQQHLTPVPPEPEHTDLHHVADNGCHGFL